MRVGIISNSDSFIPLAYTLAINDLQVYIFYSSSPDAYINQKTESFAKASKIPFVIEGNKNSNLYQWLDSTAPDVVFMLGYKHLIDLSKIRRLKHFFNIHFGPLPAFRGPTPVFWQLKNGIEKVGLAIHQVSSKFDDGPIAWMKETANLLHYNYQLVNQVLSQLCVEGVLFLIRLLMNDLPVPVINITDTTSAYQKRPGLNEVLINWQEMSAIEICNLVRACNPWNKGALTFFNKSEVKIMDAVIVPPVSDMMNIEPGMIVDDNTQLLISCCDGKIININTLFYSDCFIPGYQAGYNGFNKGKILS